MIEKFITQHIKKSMIKSKAQLTSTVEMEKCISECVKKGNQIEIMNYNMN